MRLLCCGQFESDWGPIMSTATTKMLAAVSAVAVSSAGLLVETPVAHAQPCVQWGFDGDVTIVEHGTGWAVSFSPPRGIQASGQATAGNSLTGEPMRTGTVSGGFTSPTDLSVKIEYPEGTQIYRGRVDEAEGGRAFGETAQAPFQGKLWATQFPLTCVGTSAPAASPSQQAPPPPPPPPDQAPPPEQAPTNAISVNFSDTPGGLTVNVNNSSNVAGTCTYDATAPNSPIPPSHRDFSVGAKAGTSFQISGIRTGTTFNTVTVCRGNFQGKDLEIGRVALSKTF